MVLFSSIGCAGSALVVRPRRPPLPSDQAILEAELLCAPAAPTREGDAVDACQPTRLSVEVCRSSEEAGCDVRRGIHDLLGELDAYDDYVAELRGEEVLEDPEPD